MKEKYLITEELLVELLALKAKDIVPKDTDEETMESLVETLIHSYIMQDKLIKAEVC